MNKKDLKNFLKQKLTELQEPEKSYLEEEIKSIATNPEWDKVVELYNAKAKIENNEQNILSLYLLEIAPRPTIIEHRWSLSDCADIDLDFDPSGRDKIKDWLKKKFGERNCVSIGTYGTLGVKGSVQEISRVYGIPPAEYLTVSKLVSDEDKDLSVDDIKEKYPQVEEFLKVHPEVEHVMTKLTGMKKNIGQHAGGFIVSSDNAFDNIPIVRANKGYVTGWQESGAIKELEALGWIKVDILGLSCVEQIRICVEEINSKHPGAIVGDPYLIPTDDPKVYDLINTLELDNIFQMESKTFREAVGKIKPRSLQDISNISTLVRPGSANVDDYVKAKLNRREPKCLHHIYNHTRGLMIYQEQLMQVLMELGNFTIFEADKVRRLVRKIGKAKTSDESRDAMLKECEKYRQIYMTNAVAKIIKEDGWLEKEATEYAQKQWDQLMKQAAYAFNMPHCLEENELITLSNGKKKRVRNLKIGDKVCGLADNKITEVEISQKHYNGLQDIYQVTTNKNVKIRCTGNHKFLTNKGLKTILEIWAEKLDILEKNDFKNL
jgi:DNA polymerase-3 subunit alpha